MADAGHPQLRRRKPAVVKAVEDLDAFQKVPETCVETTSSGGTASVICFLIVLWLVVLETSYFLNPGYNFNFSPDTDLDQKLSIDVDITVAMPCSIIGADIVDSTNQNVLKFGELEEEFVHFDLSKQQRNYFSSKSNLNLYLREQYHSMKDMLWRNDFIDLYSQMPKLSSKEKFQMGPPMSCRLYGTLELNKVAGNFHITAGKTLPLQRGHAHIAAFMSERDYNFSHRIYKFSFGDGMPSIVHPLEGDEKVTRINHMSYQYFIQVVPTIVHTRFRTYRTFQYSVRELAREIDHDKGSHGISGIFFKYDMSGLKVEVTEEVYPLWKFLVRLCAVIGGVYATVKMLYHYFTLIISRIFHETSHSGHSNFIEDSNNCSAPNYDSKFGSVHRNPIIPSPSLMNSSFETPVVSFVGQEPFETPKICDIAAESKDAVTLDEDTSPLLPDILSSHSHSHSSTFSST